MLVKIFHSPLSTVAEDNLILSLKNRDKSQKHIIVTPDKKSLYYEKRMFSLLNEDAFFDVTTTTLSRFANKINNRNERILTKQGGVLIIKKILNDHINELKSFGKSCNMVGFASALYDTICMFKSCNVPYSDIDKCKNNYLTNKLNDIKFVYEKYEEYLKNDYTDSFNRLSLCAKNISKENFKDVNVYFVGFDDFTKQSYYIIDKLIKCSASVNFAVAYGKGIEGKHNSNIYLNAVYYAVVDLAKSNMAELKFETSKPNINKEKNHMLNNVFGYGLTKFNGDNNYVKLYKYETIEDEVKNTVQQIKYSIINNNLRYNNFAIVVSNFNTYKNLLLKYLKQYDLNYFLDEAILLKDTVIARYLSNYLSVAIKPNKYNIIALIKSPFGVDNYADLEEFESYIDAVDLSDYSLLKYSKNNVVAEFLSKISMFVTKSGNCKTISDFCKLVREYILNDEFEAKLQKLQEQTYLTGDLYNYRILSQSYEKLNNIFNEFQVVEGSNCSPQEFLQFVNLYMENVNITIPPVVTDAVFVTELNSGMIDNCDYVYMLGMCEGSAPKYVVDCGLISDSEIDDMPKSFKLSPSVSVINKRLKFRTFESLFEAKRNLVLSYPASNDNGDNYASTIIENFKTIFSIEPINGTLMLDQINNNVAIFNEQNFIYNNFNKSTAVNNFIDISKYWDTYNENANYVKLLNNLNDVTGGEYLNNYNFENKIANIDINTQFTKMGISEVEKFNMCPYMHFCDYILKLKENDSTELNGMMIGNILHEFLKTAVFNIDKEDDYALMLLNEILKKDDYQKFCANKKNNYVIRALDEEVVRIFKVLKKQDKLSSFKPFKTELPFLSKEPVYNDGKNKVYLTGVIDRIDTSKDGFRIIDYKTGKVDFKNYNGIHYGTKTQVVVYLGLVFDKKPNFKPLGALYLPISNEFSNDSYEELYKMQGIIENSVNNLLNYDSELSKESYASNIIDLKTDTNGNIKHDGYYKNMCLSENDIILLTDYVKENVKNTIANIVNGVIKPEPVYKKEQCRFCKYLGLCNYNEVYGNIERGNKTYPNLESLLGGDDNE